MMRSILTVWLCWVNMSNFATLDAVIFAWEWDVSKIWVLGYPMHAPPSGMSNLTVPATIAGAWRSWVWKIWERWGPPLRVGVGMIPRHLVLACCRAKFSGSAAALSPWVELLTINFVLWGDPFLGKLGVQILLFLLRWSNRNLPWKFRQNLFTTCAQRNQINKQNDHIILQKLFSVRLVDCFRTWLP